MKEQDILNSLKFSSGKEWSTLIENTVEMYEALEEAYEILNDIDLERGNGLDSRITLKIRKLLDKIKGE